MTVQSLSSIVRQVVAVLAFVFGILSQAVSAVHLPPAIAAIMTAAGGGLLAIEHYVADPSTGNTAAAPAAPVAAAPVTAAPVVAAPAAVAAPVPAAVPATPIQGGAPNL